VTPAHEAPDPGVLGRNLNEILVGLGEAALPDELAAKFGVFAALLTRWNARMNLTAVRDAGGILQKHFVESIVCARLLPAGIETLLDFGSGAGFPGIPIALCRPETLVTLGEAQGKKAAFLREAVRVLGLSARVYGARLQGLEERFGCVALRAVDRMEEAVHGAAGMVREAGRLAVLTTISEQAAVMSAAGGAFRWESRALPGRERILLLGGREDCSTWNIDPAW
jgi:16S rRNA (guanine527-N7)-methyltransferase